MIVVVTDAYVRVWSREIVDECSCRKSSKSGIERVICVLCPND